MLLLSWHLHCMCWACTLLLCWTCAHHHTLDKAVCHRPQPILPPSLSPAPPGIILGVVCGVVLLVAIVSAFAIRRHRLKKNDGQALVRKWEAERRYGERHSC